MCITVWNPSEPCCSDADRRCQGCAETDWQNYTWLWEQPEAAAFRRFVGAYPIIGLPSETVEYDSRYGAMRQKMTKAGGCQWYLSGSREFRIQGGTYNTGYPVGEWVFISGFLAWSEIVLQDSDFPGEPDAGNFFEDGWHSSECYLKRLLIDGRYEWRAGWSTQDFGNAPQYVLRGEFDCEGVNEFYRDDSIDGGDLPVWLSLDDFPEWIRVSRVSS